MPKLLAAGYGYSVTPLAQRLIAEGWEVVGTTRNPEKTVSLKAAGVTPFLWDGAVLPAAGADVVVISVAPDEEGCPVARNISSIDPDTVLLYLSSTGVYGDFGGAWIDETAPCEPASERGQRRLVAERQWQDLAAKSGARLHLCRLAGIYGPGRNAIESLQGGTRGARAGLSQRVIKPGQVFNRIHRDDIAAALYALVHAPNAPTVINFADDEPSPPQDVITFAADLLGVEPPPEVPFEAAELSPMGRSFYEDNKRLKNERLKSLPRFALRYPNYREGLRAIAASI